MDLLKRVNLLAGQARSDECPRTATAAVSALRQVVLIRLIVIRNHINRGCCRVHFSGLDFRIRTIRLRVTIQRPWQMLGLGFDAPPDATQPNRHDLSTHTINEQWNEHISAWRRLHRSERDAIRAKGFIDPGTANSVDNSDVLAGYVLCIFHLATQFPQLFDTFPIVVFLVEDSHLAPQF